jgi:hypothetical protein
LEIGKLQALFFYGIELFATGSGTISGTLQTDRCNGKDDLEGKVCFSISITGGARVGANYSLTFARRVWGTWVTVYEVKMGVYATMSANISISRCYDKNGWGKMKLCSGFDDVNLTINLGFWGHDIKLIEGYKECIEL